jgi:predicted transcriptional regulator
MRTIQLDEETSRDLDELSSQQQITPEELIRQLVRDRLQQPSKPKTVMEKLQEAERRRGEPRHFLQGRSDLSDRDVRKAIIAQKMQEKYQRIQDQL